MGLNEYDEKALSKYLCFLLRHKPERAKLDMDKHGWVAVEQLITNINLYSKYHLDIYLLEKIVAEDDKGRYVFDENYEHIKCCQGHSIPWVEPELKYCSPPSDLYHGTTAEALEAILKSGAIKKMQRHAVHLHSDIDEAWRAAVRWGKTPVVLKISALEMECDGFCFGVAETNMAYKDIKESASEPKQTKSSDVWLVESVPVRYICEELTK